MFDLFKTFRKSNRTPDFDPNSVVVDANGIMQPKEPAKDVEAYYNEGYEAGMNGKAGNEGPSEQNYAFSPWFMGLHEGTKERARLKKQGEPEYNPEKVLNPDHYHQIGLEPFLIIKDWRLDFWTGNALKYVARCDHKGNALDDLYKARKYCQEARKMLEVNAITEDFYTYNPKANITAGEIVEAWKLGSNLAEFINRLHMMVTGSSEDYCLIGMIHAIESEISIRNP